MAAKICQATISLISLVDQSRQLFKSRVGFAQQQTKQDVCFCTHTILKSQLLIVEDALFDQRFQDNPLVLEDPHIRLYAGLPLNTLNDQSISTLCVIDRMPK